MIHIKTHSNEGGNVIYVRNNTYMNEKEQYLKSKIYICWVTNIFKIFLV